MTACQWKKLPLIKEGKLLSNVLSSYKETNLFLAPNTIEVIPVKIEAILKSKTMAFSPLMYDIGAYLQNAIKAFNTNYDMQFYVPMLPEKTLIGLYQNN